MNAQHPHSGRLIIVEDDEDLRASIVKYLELKGYDVTGVGTALDFYSAVAVHRYAVAILDLALPDQDGLVISKYIRANTSMRILMLTARTTVEDRLAGYESGADVYLVKPVDFRELTASIINLLNRAEAEGFTATDAPHPADERWTLNTKEWMLITPEAVQVRLTSKEYIFLSVLLASKNNIVSREDLLNSLDYSLNESGNRSLESLVYRLRKKISPRLETPIKTASGSGYTFSSQLYAV